MTRKTLRRMCILAGMAVLSVAANAFVLDVKIAIDRALNSPTLTIRYSGASASLIELKLNGESMGTRSVNASKSSGETNFNINLAALNDGENIVEVCLYDKNGKLVGVEKSTINADSGANSPIFLSSPKVGATVQGPVEIKVGFGRELKDTYVSFFVDNQFKSMMNVAPFNFIWDTTHESNGWHELEAWVVDQSSQTMKTRKVKVFVNNPGGRTDRKIETPPSTNSTPPTTSNSTGAKATRNTAQVVEKTSQAIQPESMGTLALNPSTSNMLSEMSGVKPTSKVGASATGPKFLTPTGTRVAKNTQGPKQAVMSTANTLANNAGKIAITKGQRLPNMNSLVLLYNKQFVDFDVSPRVENGIPLTPIRHLLEKAGGEVNWKAFEKAVEAKAQGREIFIAIGNRDAKIDGRVVELEVAPFIENGRTVVPLSFIRETLSVNIEFDKATGHVLITPIKK